MKAGRQMDYRKIDALVAEHIMEFEFYISGDDVRIKLDGTGMFVYFSPSKNISAAWQVVEKMQSDGYMYSISNILTNGKFTTQFEFARNTDFDLKWLKATSETAPLAICIASLRLKGIDTNE